MINKMKKEAIFILILFAISLAIAQSSLELNTENNTIQPGETLLGVLTTTGTFEKILTLDNIEIFEGKKKTYFDSAISIYNNTQFFYIYLTRQGNFTIKINNILYKENNELKSISFEEDIEVKELFIDENKTQTQILSIKPGFIFSSDGFEITLKNLGNTNLSISYLSESLELNTQENSKISFTPEQTFSFLEISTYKNFKIPIIYTPFTQEENQTQEKEILLKSSPGNIQLKINQNKTQNQTIKLFNFAETNITNIKITKSLNMIQTSDLEKIIGKSNQNLTITINAQEQGFFKDNLTISFEQDATDFELIIPIEIFVFPSNISIEQINENQNSCQELGGKICVNQKCEGEYTYTSNQEYCCLGECKDFEKDPKDSSSSYSWIWGIVIFIAVGTAGFFIYKKVKKSKPQKPQDKLQQTSKLYENRVKGKLSKI